MPSTDTQVQQLVINVGTTQQIEDAIEAGDITENMLSITTDGGDAVTDVEVNGTSVVEDGVASIDLSGYLTEITSSDVTTALGYTPESKSDIVVLSATDSITLADNTIYNGSTQTALTIDLWAAPTVASIAEVVFTSGATATTLSYSNTIKWLGDDITGGLFIPVTNKRYTIMFYYDGVETVGVVKGVE